MSGRPLEPQHPDVTRLQRRRVRRRRQGWHPMISFGLITCLPVGLMIGLTWWLVSQTEERRRSDPTWKTTSAPPRDPPVVPASLPEPDDTHQDSPAVDVWSSFDTGEVLFESNQTPHGNSSIDEIVLNKLDELQIPPSNLCTDEAFLRRVYLDTLGTLPTLQEARDFLDDNDPSKRAKLIEHVLDQPEFADYWAMRWCDVLRVKAEFPINLWPNAAQAYHRWIHTAVGDNLPYDQFAHQLLTSTGSNFRNPQVNFYRAIESKQPTAIAQAVALTFLCERTDHWPDERIEGMSRFFSKVGFKPTGEWKEEIVFFDTRKGDAQAPRAPLRATFPNGATVEIPADEDPRLVFADWLIDEKNPWFARAASNRIWFWLLGRGIVDPPDDVRVDNPPSNRLLLDHLAGELIASDYDLKHLIRLILNSDVYQLACVRGTDQSKASEHFAYYQPRRLDAEVLIDAICQITGTTETYMSIIPEPYTFLPARQRAISLPDGSITSSFLEMFGRPARDTGMMSERNNRLTASQALHLLNSNHIRNKIRKGQGVRELARAKDPSQTAQDVYLAILSRRPTISELSTASQLCEYSAGQHDLVWALINSDEFLFRH